jgi:hypothetical protein
MQIWMVSTIMICGFNVLGLNVKLILVTKMCFPYKKLLAGRNFGDEGLFFLAESLGYNQVRFLKSFTPASRYGMSIYSLMIMAAVSIFLLTYLILLL